MKGRARALAVLIASALAILGCALVLKITLANRDQFPASPVLAANSSATRAPTTFAGRRKTREQTIWADEMTALDHETVFTELWDQLRQTTNQPAVWQKFEFGELLVGALSEKQSVAEPQLQRATFGKPYRVLSSAAWGEAVSKLQRAGYELLQSEWRHAEFSAAPEAKRSVFYVSGHIINRATNERLVLRGPLQVDWDNSRRFFPRRIDATQLEVLAGPVDPPFQRVALAEVTPVEPALGLEPSLQLYDLDRNGLSDVVLIRNNVFLRNQGQARFAAEPLFNQPAPSLLTAVIADFDGDGAADLLGADVSGLMLYPRFQPPQKSGARVWTAPHPLPNPSVMSAGDIDGDGDLDVWLAQYKVPYKDGQMPTPYYDANDGHPAFLLVNEGNGRFSDRTEAAGLAAKRYRRTYSASFADLDADRDLDLLVVSDFAGIDLYLNQGNGTFQERTAEQVPRSHGFGMAHVLADFDRDTQLDLFMVGMNSFTADRLSQFQPITAASSDQDRYRPIMASGNRLLLRRQGQFRETELGQTTARAGWAWGAAAADFDNDGDLDLYVGNGHITGRSAKDYEAEFWRHDLYFGNSREDPELDRYFSAVRAQYVQVHASFGGYEKNRFFLNQAHRAFIETGHLLGVALEEDCRAVAADDLDGDGRVDLLVTTFHLWPAFRQTLYLFQNQWPRPGNWIGVRLTEGGPGKSPLGATILVPSAPAPQLRQLVTGDSYRTQHAPTAHFGLGQSGAPVEIEVRWLNGHTQSIKTPQLNRYYDVIP